MNFLAHLYLSFGYEELLVGNFVGDFISNKQVQHLSRPYQKGVELHRLIDDFTDKHPTVKKCTALLHSTQGKYSPVVMDILFDYLLFSNWNKYSDIPFSEFKLQTYAAIGRHITHFPEKTASRAISMVKGDFLESYTSIEGLTFTFHRLERRLRFPSNLAFAILDLKEHQVQFTQRFNLFFPELIKLSKDFIAKNT